MILGLNYYREIGVKNYRTYHFWQLFRDNFQLIQEVSSQKLQVHLTLLGHNPLTLHKDRQTADGKQRVTTIAGKNARYYVQRESSLNDLNFLDEKQRFRH